MEISVISQGGEKELRKWTFRGTERPFLGRLRGQRLLHFFAQLGAVQDQSVDGCEKKEMLLCAWAG